MQHHEQSSIVQVMERHAARKPDEVIYQFLREGEVVEAQWTFQEVDARAKAIASILAGHARVGDRALLLYPPGLEYIAAFMACLCAGLIAVSAYPPRGNKASPQLDAIVDDSSPRLILTTTSLADSVRRGVKRGAAFIDERLIVTDSPDLAFDSHWRRPGISGRFSPTCSIRLARPASPRA